MEALKKLYNNIFICTIKCSLYNIIWWAFPKYTIENECFSLQYVRKEINLDEFEY